MPWRTIDGEDVAPASHAAAGGAAAGVFDRRRFLDLIRHFIVFEDDGGKVVEEDGRLPPVPRGQQGRGRTVEASRPKGDRRVGVVWHTQG